MVGNHSRITCEITHTNAVCLPPRLYINSLDTSLLSTTSIANKWSWLVNNTFQDVHRDQGGESLSREGGELARHHNHCSLVELVLLLYTTQYLTNNIEILHHTVIR